MAIEARTAYLAAAALLGPEAAAGPGTLEGRGAMEGPGAAAESAEAASRGTAPRAGTTGQTAAMNRAAWPASPPHPDGTGSMSGRRKQAARNDRLILESARAVFLEDPGAPITAVAQHAKVGISALYSRYGSKEELLRRLCAEGLARFVAETEAALADPGEPWTVFAGFIRRLVAADTSSMTLALAGRFTPTPAMFELAMRSDVLLRELFDRVRPALRDDADVHDLSLIFEMIAAIKTPDRDRTMELRQRYTDVVLAGLRAPAPGTPPQDPLPGRPPRFEELSARWAPRNGAS
jgi:AcrR family transcriptional regulator